MTTEKLDIRPRQVAHLRIGNQFMWAGRVVTLVRAEGHKQNRWGKKSRYLVVETELGIKRLNYDDKELVEVVRV